MTLERVAENLHGIGCLVCLLYAYLRRRSVDKSAVALFAFVWCVWFMVAIAHEALLGILPLPKSDLPFGIRRRVLLDLESALYLVWPCGIFAWLGWTFRRWPVWPSALVWLCLSLLPSLVFPSLRGESWFPLAGSIHLIAFLIELILIIAWIRLRERPRVWHTAGMVAAIMTVFPAIPFFVSSEARAGYLQWVLRGLVAGHLAILAIVGGELWTRSSGPSPS